MSLIEKIKINIINIESKYKNIMSESYINRLTYEDYVLRSRISVFKHRDDL